MRRCVWEKEPSVSSRQYLSIRSPCHYFCLFKHHFTISPAHRHHPNSISRLGAAKVNGWTLLRSISPVYPVLLVPLFPAPLAQDIFIGSSQRLTSWHLTDLGITLWVNCTQKRSVPPPPAPGCQCTL